MRYCRKFEEISKIKWFDLCTERLVELVKEGGVKAQLVEVTMLVNMWQNSRKHTGKMSVSCKRGVLVVDCDYVSD